MFAWARGGLIVLILLLYSEAFAQSGCPRCDRSLDLTGAEWSCLLRRLPELSATDTPIVFFSLAPSICNPDMEASRSSAVVMPSRSSASGTRSRVFRLSRDQVACLAERAATVPLSDAVTFDFSTCEQQRWR